MNTTNKTLLKLAQKSNVLNFNGNYAIYFKNEIQFITPSNPGKFVNGNFVKDSNIDLTEFEVPTFTNCVAILEGQKLEDLKPWIKKAFNFVGKDDLRPVMSGVFIGGKDIVATDAHIMYKKQFEYEISPENMILNALTCQLIDNVKVIYKYNNEFIALLDCGTIITYCTIDGKFPNYNAVIPTEFDGSFILNCVSTEFKDALKLNYSEIPTLAFNTELKKAYWRNQHNGLSGEFDIKEGQKIHSNELVMIMYVMTSEFKNITYINAAYNQKLLAKISKATNQSELILTYKTNKQAVIYLPETTNKPTKTKKVMEEKPKQSVDNDILSALMQQINALSQQVAELKNQQISAPKNEIAPIKESAKIQEQKPIEIEKPIINVQKYSDKSLIVYGDTKQIKDKLMQLHARFNPYLKLNEVKTPGWIVSVKHEVAINQIVQTL